MRSNVLRNPFKWGNRPVPDRPMLSPATWRDVCADWLRRLANELRPVPMPVGRGGRILHFVAEGTVLGRTRYAVMSVRGGFRMGTLEWSNQWRRPKFVPASDAVFDQQAVAEIFAMMKEFL